MLKLSPSETILTLRANKKWFESGIRILIKKSKENRTERRKFVNLLKEKLQNIVRIKEEKKGEYFG